MGLGVPGLWRPGSCFAPSGSGFRRRSFTISDLAWSEHERKFNLQIRGPISGIPFLGGQHFEVQHQPTDADAHLPGVPEVAEEDLR